LFYPEIDTTNDYGLDLSVDESELFNRFMETSDTIMDKSRELDEQIKAEEGAKEEEESSNKVWDRSTSSWVYPE
jgi:hypothetical protein